MKSVCVYARGNCLFILFKTSYNINVNVNVRCVIFRLQFHWIKNILSPSIKIKTRAYTHTLLKRKLHTGKNGLFTHQQNYTHRKVTH